MKAASETMYIADLAIEVRRKKMKNLRLVVHPPEGAVTFSVPLGIAKRDIQRFLEERIDWIKAQQASIQSQDYAPATQFLSGDTVHVWGEGRCLQIKEGAGRPGFALAADNTATLRVKVGSSREQRARVIDNWYRQEIKQAIPKLLETWQPIVGRYVDAWGVKKMKTRWGTCNIQAKRIWLNLDLAKWPPSCLEYVVVHELTHLHERHHNARFKTLLDQFMPDWRAREALLKARLHER